MAAERTTVTADEQFLARGSAVSQNRPYFQGDVFRDVPLPQFPEAPPPGVVAIPFKPTNVMLLPHPCGCHVGDKLRTALVVAPLAEAPTDNPISRIDWTGRFDFYPLVEVMDGQSYRASLGDGQSIPSAWLTADKRVACLSLLGVALLGQRLLKHLARMPEEAENLMVYYQTVWSDAMVWEAWRTARKTPNGYEEWKKAAQEIEGVGNVRPVEVLTSRTAQLISHLLGDDTPEKYRPE